MRTSQGNYLAWTLLCMHQVITITIKICHIHLLILRIIAQLRVVLFGLACMIVPFKMEYSLKGGKLLFILSNNLLLFCC